MDKNKYFRSIPKVDSLLDNEDITHLLNKYNRDLVVDTIRQEINEIRLHISSNSSEVLIEKKINCIVENIKNSIEKITSINYKKVINATGVIIHTNLGRSVISELSTKRIIDIVTGYSNLEYNLYTGNRGSRYSHFERLITKITGSEAALVVNNNAAAVMLILNTLAKDKEVIVSRGELVEIGGSFRVPDVMTQSGAKLVEVGTTNKTHKKDYERAINENTGVLLKVHTSNYKIVGFTESVSIENVVNTGKKHKIPVVEDLGSGVLIDLSKYGLTREPTVQDSVNKGVDIISFSGDKLLGGPQAGIIIGKKEYIEKMKNNPLTRALRIDKFTASALESIFLEYFDLQKAVKNIPTLRMITESFDIIEKKALKLYDKLKCVASENFEIDIDKCYSQVGGGSLPLERINSCCITLNPRNISTSSFENKLRLCKIPIICRIVNDKVLLDLRTVKEEELDIISNQIIELIGLV